MTERITTIMLERVGDEGWEWTRFCDERDRLVLTGTASTLAIALVAIRAEIEVRDALS